MNEWIISKFKVIPIHKTEIKKYIYTDKKMFHIDFKTFVFDYYTINNRSMKRFPLIQREISAHTEKAGKPGMI